MHTQKYWVRDTAAEDSLEIMMVAAIASFLLIRALLAATGYPKLGGAKLHIAHMLWGGLFMLAALIILLTFWNPSVRTFAAFLGGIGFGTFIDELGKFITSDNDYFFQPTVALIYLIFMTLFLAIRALQRSRALREDEIYINEIIRETIDDRESAAIGGRFQMYFELRRRLNRRYIQIISHPWFERLLVGGFVVFGAAAMFTVLGFIFWDPVKSLTIPVAESASTLISNVFIWAGIWQLRKSRLAGYRMFERSILVNLFVTQVFLFYHSQFGALSGFAVNLLIYAALRYFIRREQMMSHRETAHKDDPSLTGNMVNG